MKIKLVENVLKEEFSKEDLLEVLELIGEAHDKIIEAQDILSYMESEDVEEFGYRLEDIEAELSECDYMGYSDPVGEFMSHQDIIEDESLCEDNTSKIKNVETNHTMDEYTKKFGKKYDDGDLWDFSKEDLENGAIEPNDNMVYWLIDGRYYETSEE